MIDQDGFRENVGIIVANAKGQLLWAKRAGSRDAWQFPQGGIDDGETPVEAMYRELREELGLTERHVDLLAESTEWLMYRLPMRFRRRDDSEHCIGQKQKWFLLELIAQDQTVNLEASLPPEFDAWRWVDYWFPLRQVIFFKRAVYRKVLKEFERSMPCTGSH